MMYINIRFTNAKKDFICIILYWIEEECGSSMEKEKIYEMVIREMAEYALQERYKQSTKEQKLQERIKKLSDQMQEKIKHLPKDVREVIEEYLETTAMSANHDCIYLYSQGIKDCIELLKKLGII